MIIYIINTIKNMNGHQIMTNKEIQTRKNRKNKNKNKYSKSIKPMPSHDNMIQKEIQFRNKKKKI